MTATAYYPSPLGAIAVEVDGGVVVSLRFVDNLNNLSNQISSCSHFVGII